jgi:hypothetical protein
VVSNISTKMFVELQANECMENAKVKIYEYRVREDNF